VIPQDLTPAILEGDVIDRLRSLPGDSIHCVVTSPPYWGLRDYGLRPVRWGGKARCEHDWEPTRPLRHPGPHGGTGGAAREVPSVAYDASKGGSTCRKCWGWLGQLGLEQAPERFVDHLAGVFDEVRRVLRPDGTLWLNLGDTYATHPSGLTGEKRWKTSTLAARDYSGAEQAGRVDKRAPGLKPKDLVGIPWRVAFELQRRGWWLRSDCVWAKPNPMPEAVRDRPTRAHDSVFLLTKSRRYFYDAYAVREPLQESTLRRLRHHLPNPAENRTSRSKHPEGDFRRFPLLRNTSPSGRNLRTVWWIPTQLYRGAHFATFPEKLPELCILAGSSERGACVECGSPWTREVRATGGAIDHAQSIDAPLVSGRAPVADAPGWHDGSYRRVDLGFRKRCSCGTNRTVPCLVLDPFAGSGTVLAVARRLGRRSIGIELNPDYVTLARHRSAAAIADVVAREGAPA
jgi:DNA modification methylase